MTILVTRACTDVPQPSRTSTSDNPVMTTDARRSAWTFGDMVVPPPATLLRPDRRSIKHACRLMIVFHECPDSDRQIIREAMRGGFFMKANTLLALAAGAVLVAPTAEARIT